MVEFIMREFSNLGELYLYSVLSCDCCTLFGGYGTALGTVN